MYHVPDTQYKHEGDSAELHLNCTVHVDMQWISLYIHTIIYIDI